jgi:hypothetical protein
MKFIKKFNENLSDSFNINDIEISDFFDWVLKYCTERLRFQYDFIQSDIDVIPDYCIWRFNRSYYDTTEEYVKNWRKGITTFDLYNIWCELKNNTELRKPTIKQQLDYNFLPVNFLEWIAKNNYWLYRSSYNGVVQPTYWTRGNNATSKFSLEDLFNQYQS